MRAQTQDSYGDASSVATQPSTHYVRTASRQIWRCTKSSGATVNTTCAHKFKTDLAMHQKRRCNRQRNMRAQTQDRFGDASTVAAQSLSQYARTNSRQIWRCIKSGGATVRTTIALPITSSIRSCVQTLCAHIALTIAPSLCNCAQALHKHCDDDRACS